MVHHILALPEITRSDLTLDFAATNIKTIPRNLTLLQTKESVHAEFLRGIPGYFVAPKSIIHSSPLFSPKH
jgi:hypothetical protein